MNYRVIEQPNYTPQEVFQLLYRRGTSCLLESASRHSRTGRYSIVATEPDFVFRSWGNKIQIDEQPPETGDPLLRLRELLGRRPAEVALPDLPLAGGGAIGYLGYDSVRLWEDIGNRVVKDIKDIAVPDIYLLFYSKLIVFDHILGKVFLVGYEELPAAVDGPAERISGALGHIRPALSKEAFEEMVLAAKEYIAAGDIYQANISQRLEVESEASGWSLYKKLQLINPSPLACYLDLQGLEVISCSPERLVKVEGKVLQTRPIAGTYPRSKNVSEDRDLARRLVVNPKERAEHIMLVDLERNDLGRVSRYGTVRVDELMAVETYSHVHHIVSNVQGVLREDVDQVDVIKALFPGGTITGCPKIRCMQIIDELEPLRRNIYTGSVGFLEYSGNLDLNIVIRTIQKIDKRLLFQVGAGIVADSVPEREYYETLHKAGALIEAVKDGAGVPRKIWI